MNGKIVANESSLWEKVIPWFLTFVSFLTLVCIGFFLISNINWFKDSVFNNVPGSELEYRMYAYHVHLSMIKRSVGLFSGFALTFIGSGVAFFSMKKNTKLDLKSAGITANLVTASPGIIAMILGIVLIINTIKSKDEFPMYYHNSQNISNLTTTPLPER
jgi:hypothetical protein